MSPTLEASVDAVDLAPLWEEVDLGPHTLRNRVVLNPLHTHWSHQGVLSERHLDYYEARAEGGLGLLITEQHGADRERIGRHAAGSSALEPRNLPMLEQLSARVQSHGAKLFVQIYASGTQDQSNISMCGFSPTWAPSYIPSANHREPPRVMGAAEIRTLVDNFVRAARNIASTGADGIELHAAHGWLLHRFLSPLYNKRTDAYGGSTEARTLLVRQIAEKIRAVTPGMTLGIQISIDDYQGTAGVTPDYVEEELGFLGHGGLFDYINLSTGNELSDDETIPPMERLDIPAEVVGARARAAVAPEVKILVGGGVRTVEQAARLVREGSADLVCFARPLFADPEIVRKAQAGAADEIRPCIGLNQCFRTAMQGRGVTCVVNPFAGREGQWRPGVRSTRVRDVVVVGAGPAGLQAATAAADHGHRVTVLEREPATGGHLRLLAALPNRHRWNDAIDWFDGAARRANVEIRTEHLAEAGSDELRAADVVLFATGSRWQRTGYSPSRPQRDGIPGLNLVRVATIDDAIRRAAADPRTLGDHVLIVDETQGYLPLGLADLVSQAGVKVDVVTPLPVVGGLVALGWDHKEIYGRLAGRDVTFHAGHSVETVAEDRVVLSEGWSRRQREVPGVDTVVLGLFREPNQELFADAGHPAEDSQLVGDALAPRDTREVVAEGQDIGYAI